MSLSIPVNDLTSISSNTKTSYGVIHKQLFMYCKCKSGEALSNLPILLEKSIKNGPALDPYILAEFIHYHDLRYLGKVIVDQRTRKASKDVKGHRIYGLGDWSATSK